MPGLQMLGFGRSQIEALVSMGAATTGEGAAPATGLYFHQTAGAVDGVWLNGTKRLDTSGTPADGSVTQAKIAGTLLASLFKPWRSRHAVATTISSASVSGKKYFILNGQSSQSEPAPSVNQPWRIGWVAADEAVEGLTAKCKIKAEVVVAGAIKATVHVALYKVTKGEKLTLGEEVPGSGFDIAAGTTTNTGITGESAEFAMPEDGDYALGCTVSATAEATFGVQARHMIHNVS